MLHQSTGSNVSNMTIDLRKISPAIVEEWDSGRSPKSVFCSLSMSVPHSSPDVRAPLVVSAPVTLDRRKYATLYLSRLSQ